MFKAPASSWLGLSAIVLAYAGQTMLTPEPGWIDPTRAFHAGWILLAAGALLFGYVWFGRQSANERPPIALSLPPGGASALSPPPTVWLLLGTAVAIYLIEILDWFVNGETARTRWLWGTGVLVLLAALLRWRHPVDAARRPSDPLPRWVAATYLLAVVAIAAALRLIDLARVPLDVHGDFASMGLAARELLSGDRPDIFAAGWAEMARLTFLPSAFTMTVFGDNLFGLRMAGVIAGMLAVAGIYGLTAELFERHVALVAAAVSAIGYVDVHFSRVGAYIEPLPWMVVGVWLLVRGLRRGSISDFGLSGMLLAVTFELYYSGRLAGPVLVVFVCYLGIAHRRLLTSHWRGWLVLIAAAIVTSGPMPFYHLQHWDSFVTRSREVYAFNSENLRHLMGKYEVTTTGAVFNEQLWRSLLTFNYTPDSSTQFGFSHPFLNPALAPLFVLGAACSLARARRVGHALLSIWLVGGIVLGSVLTVDAPFWPRIVILLPVVATLTAFGLLLALETLSVLFHRRPPGPWQRLVVATAILAAVGYQNYRWYFGGTIATAAPPITWIGRVIGEAPPGTGFCMLRGSLSLEDRVPVFLGQGRDMRDVAPEQVEVMLPRCVAENRIWIIVQPEHAALLDTLRTEWPQGRERPVEGGIPSPPVLFWYPPDLTVR